MPSLESLFLQTVALVNEPPGSLVYYLVLLFALEAAVVSAVGRWRQSRGKAEARLAFALASIFGLQLIAFAAAAFSAVGLLDPLTLIPPLDRAVSSLTIIAIIWLFAFPQPARPADAAAAALAFAALIGVAVGASLWTQDVARGVEFFNGTPQETTWELAQLALLVVGTALVAIRARPGWGLGTALLVMLLVGHAIHYLYPLAGANVAGAERLARILALPLLTALVYRTPPLSAVSGSEAVPESHMHAPPAEIPYEAPLPVAAPDAEPQRLRWATDPKAMVALLSLGSAATPNEMARIVTMALGRAFIADLTLLVAAPDTSGMASIACAFNLIREKFLTPQFALPLGQMPELSVAFNRGEAVRLTLPAHEAELQQIAEAVAAERPGPALVIPLTAEGSMIVGAIILASPFAQREWTSEDQNLLMTVSTPILAALNASDHWGQLQQAVADGQQRTAAAEQALLESDEAKNLLAAGLEESQSGVRQMETELAAARQELERQRQDAEQLIVQLETEHAAASNQAALQSEIEELRARYQAAQSGAEARDRLETDLGAAQEQLKASAKFEVELGHAQEELAYQQARSEQLARELEGTRAELRRLREQIPVAPVPVPAPSAEAENAAMAAAKKAVGASQAKLDQRTAELAAARAEITALQRRVAEAQQAMDAAPKEQPEAVVSGGTRMLVNSLTQSMEVIASLSQELRQPMSSIVGYSDLLMGESVGILGALQRKFLERIKASTERMGSLLDDLIRVTALDSGKLELIREALDVVKVVEDAILSVGAQFREKGINLQLNIADDIPAVTADRDAVRQVLGHLLNNAGSASAIDGAVTLTVQRETDQPRGGDPLQYLFISVRDTGGGIAPEDQPRVFSRLYRADAPLIAGLGDTGVGLSIAKALVEAHAGRIWVNSEMGQGSTFCVLLPLDSAPANIPGGNGAH